MATKPSWPDPASSSLLGRRISRVEAPAKTRGAVKYTYDQKRPGMLWGAVARCPHARARITAIDTTAAAKMPGVKAVHVVKKVGDEVKWALDEVAYVAATTEAQANDAARAIRVAYEVLPATVVDDDPKAPGAKEQAPDSKGDPDGAAASAKARIEGRYGLPVVAHLCLEAHGQVVEWNGDSMTAWCSTQAVSGLPGQFAEGLDIPASKVRVLCEHMGGGFGSKFSVDAWGIACAELARKAGAPVKLMLDRAAEVALRVERRAETVRRVLLHPLDAGLAGGEETVVDGDRVAEPLGGVVPAGELEQADAVLERRLRVVGLERRRARPGERRRLPLHRVGERPPGDGVDARLGFTARARPNQHAHERASDRRRAEEHRTEQPGHQGFAQLQHPDAPAPHERKQRQNDAAQHQQRDRVRAVLPNQAKHRVERRRSCGRHQPCHTPEAGRHEIVDQQGSDQIRRNLERERWAVCAQPGRDPQQPCRTRGGHGAPAFAR